MVNANITVFISLKTCPFSSLNLSVLDKIVWRFNWAYESVKMFLKLLSAEFKTCFDASAFTVFSMMDLKFFPICWGQRHTLKIVEHLGDGCASQRHICFILPAA
mmetsp:Transcript_67084/g.98145  ORF Transcript_67084/g.98145 Transcript_67084/m.98145 type:complete len:104 (+) Transcript_67084:1049-1360(+)